MAYRLCPIRIAERWFNLGGVCRLNLRLNRTRLSWTNSLEGANDLSNREQRLHRGTSSGHGFDKGSRRLYSHLKFGTQVFRDGDGVPGQNVRHFRSYVA